MGVESNVSRRILARDESLVVVVVVCVGTLLFCLLFLIKINKTLEQNTFTS